MEEVILTNDNYKEYIIERTDTEGKKTLEIKEGVTVIRCEMKELFNGVTEIILPDSVKELHCSFENTLEKIKLSSNLIKINPSLFAGMENLKEICIPEGIIDIGNSAFERCRNLKKVELPESLESIETYAFWNCESLEEINIPKGLKKMGYGVFINCKSLHEFEIFSDIDYSTEDGLLERCIELKKLTIPAWDSEKQRSLFKEWNGYEYLDYNNLEEITFLPVCDNIENFADYISKSSTLKKVVLPEGMMKIREKQYEYYTNLEEVVIPSTIETIEPNAFANCKKMKKIVLPDGLKKIDEFAFAYCEQLEEIIIPDSVEVIEEGAFDGCINLKKVKLSNGLKQIGTNAFKGCSLLEEIEVPEGVESLEEGCFKECKNLKKIKLPNTLKKIGSNVFQQCERLEEIIIPESVEDIDKFAFYNCLSLKEFRIPKNVKNFCINALNGCEKLEEIRCASIGNFYYSYKKYLNDNFALENCDNLKRLIFEDGVESINLEFLNSMRNLVEEVIIPESVEELKGFSFENFKKLKTVVLPDGMEKIGGNAFYGCNNLKNIRLPKNLKIIPQHCFYGCSSLESIEIPDGVEKIEESAFGYCGSLKNVKIPESVNCIGDSAFSHCGSLTEISLPRYLEYIASNLFLSCENLEFLKLPEMIKDEEITASSELMFSKATMGISAFQDCTKLKSVILPSNMQTICLNMFKDCENLENIILPSGIRKIEQGAFYGAGIKSIKLPEGIKTIEKRAFYQCQNLTDINFPESLVKVKNAFEGCSYDIINSIPCKCKCEEGDVLSSVSPEDIQDGKLVIPKGVKVIKSLVFYENETERYYSVDSSNRKKVRSIIIPDSVARIEDIAINEFPNLEEVIMPDSILELGEKNFRCCYSLRNVRLSRRLKHLPRTVLDALNESNISCLIIPDSIDEITDLREDNSYCGKEEVENRFAYCSYIKIISSKECEDGKTKSFISVYDDEIESDYSYLGSNWECVEEKTGVASTKVLKMDDVKHADKVSEYIVDGSYKMIGPCAFAQCPELEIVVIEDGVKVIGPGAFAGCNKLKTVVVPSSVTKISPYAFYGCKALKEIEIPGKEVDIGDFAFKDCSGLLAIWLPNKVNKIGKFAFNGCDNLNTVVGAKKVTEIDDYAFMGCKRLPLIIPGQIQRIGNYAFTAVGSELKETGNNEHDEFRKILHSSIDIPNTIEDIGEYAFSDCTGFNIVYFYENVALKKIKKGTFKGCKGLDDTVVLPKQVEEVEEEAFCDCDGLKVVNFPKKLKKIYGNAFKNCISLEKAIFCSEEKRDELAESTSFVNCDNLQKYYLYDYDFKYKVDDKGRIIGTTKEEKKKGNITLLGISQAISSVLGKKVKTKASEDNRRAKLERAIQNNLDNMSLEQLEQICNIMGMDLGEKIKEDNGPSL